MRMRFIAFLTGVLLALAATLVPPSASAYPSFFLQWHESGTSQCLGISGGSSSNGALLYEQTCKSIGSSGSYSQQIKFSTYSHTRLIVRHSSKCLDGYDGMYVRQMSCGTAPGQFWSVHLIDSLPDGSYPRMMFQNEQTGRCVSGLTASSVVTQAACDSADPKQVWVGRFRVCETCLSTPPSPAVPKG